MFFCHDLSFLDCPCFFTGIFGVTIVKQISERGKITVVHYGMFIKMLNLSPIQELLLVLLLSCLWIRFL